jgi:ParB/RepB/Spo0J family partition protein
MELEFGQLDQRYALLRATDPRREARMLASLSERGQQTPVVVVAADRPGHFVLIDGHKRVRALEKLRADLVEGTVWSEAEQEALVIERGLRSSSSACGALEDAWLLRELRDRHGMKLAELAQRLDKSESWVSRRLGLVSLLPLEVQEHVRRGALVAHAAMKFLVPLARANRQACLTLSARLAQRPASTREVGAIYAAWLAGDEGEREMLLEDPWLFLQLQAEVAAQPIDEESAAEALTRELGGITGIARRVTRQLREGAARTLTTKELDDTRRSLAAALSSVEQLKTRAQKELVDARPDDPVGDPAAA